MAERMDALIRADPSQVFFFAFGAAHFHGERSVQALLEKKFGYQIRPVFEGDDYLIKLNVVPEFILRKIEILLSVKVN